MKTELENQSDKHSPTKSLEQRAREASEKIEGCIECVGDSVEFNKLAASVIILSALKEGESEQKFPDIGKDPLKFSGEVDRSIDAVRTRLSKAVGLQQKEVPDQTALVWRVDLSQLDSEYIWRNAQRQGLEKQIAALESERDQLKWEKEELRKQMEKSNEDWNVLLNETESKSVERIKNATPDISEMVNAFLAWPLPDSVCSDGCVTIKGYPRRSGTNLLTADEAKQMFEHVLKKVKQ